MTKYITIATLILALSLLASCIEDGYTSSPSDQPSFSTDTLDLGLVYTDELTATSRMTIRNPHGKSLNIEQISISGANEDVFRINVDGLAGRVFSDIEIRAKDSIFVFADAHLPENGSAAPQKVTADLNITVNGLTSVVTLAATGQDVVRLRDAVYESDATIKAEKPVIVFGDMTVAEGATLTIEPGSMVRFHDKASLQVYGTLACNGTPSQRITLTGDRTGDVIQGVSFDLMSRQWEGIALHPSSSGSKMAFTEVSNTWYGVGVKGDGSDLDSPKLTLDNCKLRNAGSCVLAAFNASVSAYGCEFAEGGGGLVYMLGGKHRFDQCTAANNYLFSAISGAAWIFAPPQASDEYADVAHATALITNCITSGLGAAISINKFDGQEITFRRCMFGVDGEDDDNFIDCIYNSDPLFYTVRSEYLFDYRLKTESPAIGAADNALSEHPLECDFYGIPRTSDLGAFAFDPSL